jgi:two-component system capsular synthesis sensor histidine kinase RcsC
MTARLLHVLIADDDATVRELLATILGTTECTVDLVSNGLEAIRAFAGRHYDLVITDFEMPVMDGKELTIAIRQLHASVPVVMVTACADIDRHAIGLTSAGVTQLIRKPFRIAEILQWKARLQSEAPAIAATPEPATDFQSRLV